MLRRSIQLRLSFENGRFDDFRDRDPGDPPDPGEMMGQAYVVPGYCPEENVRNNVRNNVRSNVRNSVRNNVRNNVWKIVRNISPEQCQEDLNSQSHFFHTELRMEVAGTSVCGHTRDLVCGHTRDLFWPHNLREFV